MEKSIIKDLLKDKDIEYYFNKYYNENNLELPILLLTILNSQNKKNNISFHGYPIACGIYLLFIVVNIINNEELNYSTCRVINILISLITKFIHENIIKINKKISNDKLNNICLELFKSLEENLGCDGLLKEINIKYHKKCDTGIKSYYKNKDNDFYLELLNKKFIKQQSLDEIIDNRLGSICQLGIKMAWIIGNGVIKEKELKRIGKLGLNFARMFQLSNDFTNLKNNDKNYIINCGFSVSYQMFLKNKQEFIEESLVLDILSITVKEILDNIENNIDNIINSTTPDLKSSLLN